MPRPPGGSVRELVALEHVLRVYDLLRRDHRGRCWPPPTQLELAVSLGWSEQTLRRYLRAHGRRWPVSRGADLEFLEGSCRAASTGQLAS